ncbi:Hypothetical predicted protein [Octopus vulgaris]|uniref:Uncharacterized protein n=1 Tax=Octopus vulgaris TaxID=6645 RepID=A0AA36ATJ0_OCTVU|nr:Hypothetical predicted protein [Octopus vulgaris]
MELNINRQVRLWIDDNGGDSSVDACDDSGNGGDCSGNGVDSTRVVAVGSGTGASLLESSLIVRIYQFFGLTYFCFLFFSLPLILFSTFTT